MTITGKTGKNANTLSATPRYAQVLSFDRCSNIAVENLTAGHTKEPGYCVGGVLLFQVYQCAGPQMRPLRLRYHRHCGYGLPECDHGNLPYMSAPYGGIQLMGVATASMD